MLENYDFREQACARFTHSHWWLEEEGGTSSGALCPPFPEQKRIKIHA